MPSIAIIPPPLASDALTIVSNAADPTRMRTLLARTVLESSTGCRIWTGGRATQGRYGIVWDGTRPILAHRAAYEASFGQLPAGSLRHESNSSEVHHSCANRLCINPAHLELVTRSQHAAAHRELRMAA
jgi:hypothetical protein